MEENEKRLQQLQREKQSKDKLLLDIERVLGPISCAMFLAVWYLSVFIIYHLSQIVLPVVMMVIAFVLLAVAVCFCILIEQKAGYYQCGKCDQKFVPTYNQTLWSMHFGRTRFLRCPHCHQKSWCKKVLK